MQSLDIKHHIEDLQKIRNFMELRGIATHNTRLDRYARFYEEIEVRGTQSIDAEAIFKNSVDSRFRSPGDWLLYVLREVHELMWIMKGLQTHTPLGVQEKLETVVGGRDFAALDRDSRSRDAQFELRIASYFCQSGFEVDMSTDTDIIASTGKFRFFIECKRIGSETQLRKRLSEARSQLRKRMPKNDGARIVMGCIAADVTKMAFSHNGLTFGMTNEHSRDIIQRKLVDIADRFGGALSFAAPRKLLGYWLQIHIASLILKPDPPTPATRFSSYQIPRPNLNRRGRRAVYFFYEKFEEVSVKDARAAPPQALAPRSYVTIPEGSTFSLDKEKLNTFLTQAGIADDEEPVAFASLNIKGKSEEFTNFDVSMLPAEYLDEWRSLVEEKPGEAAAKLIAAMYLQRYPYEPPSENDF
ncbi:hypothetical protein [Billgrantia desiderata]|uniref:hypothetical protein n=1 Tax=Billgrantia desiderata TaxID=52021 RepID=UPI0011B0518D|nr:hypothetical protein [Halomonas desiderata]